MNPKTYCPICQSFLTADPVECKVCHMYVHSDCFSKEADCCHFCARGGTLYVNKAKPNLTSAIIERTCLEVEEKNELLILLKRATTFGDLDLVRERLRLSSPHTVASLSRRQLSEKDVTEEFKVQVGEYYETMRMAIEIPDQGFPQRDVSQVMEYLLEHPNATKEILAEVIKELLDSDHIRFVATACTKRVMRALESTCAPRKQKTGAHTMKRI